MRLIYQSSLPKRKQSVNLSPDKKPTENAYQRFNSTLENSKIIEGDVNKLSESVSKSVARVWLDRASSVCSERSDTIHNTEEKDKFIELSNLLKNAIPVVDATDEDTMRSLSMLRQKINVEEGDSDHLSSVKRHLTAEIEKMLS